MNEKILLVTVKYFIKVLRDEIEMFNDKEYFDDCQAEIKCAKFCLDSLISSKIKSYGSFFKKQDNSIFSLFKVKASILFVRNCISDNARESLISQIDICVKIISDFMDCLVQEKFGEEKQKISVIKWVI